MTEISDWGQSAAGLIRNQGLVVEPLPRERIDSPARMSAKRHFEDSWADTLTVHQQLRDAGWQGVFIEVESSVPPALQPMHIAAQAARTRRGMTAPGRPDDPLVAEVAQIGRERYEAARAEQDAALGPLARTISFGD
jgi:hypothetical protein